MVTLNRVFGLEPALGQAQLTHLTLYSGLSTRGYIHALAHASQHS
jgi:hypothetical protein